MKNLFLLPLAFASTFSFANSQAYLITEFQVINNLVTFKTQPQKATNTPSCVDANNKDSWAISLNDHGSNNLYSLLLGAFDSQTPVYLTSTEQCIAESGIEKLAAVSVN
ncbi:hypothetical protein CWC22_005950 [Pseudoalteromonas rubra]|uniref:Uncharacterized protein n=1 Tax=Pseudoalteromonas rubra TaxID=43658 RepID=A0A5S3USN5_9GAMM|nr:hypothetical protein [Pseudoalteromonas rubra]QPB82558.1 hypothetical protein CWC22_005950 [Pseudoalteromonas rubra]